MDAKTAPTSLAEELTPADREPPPSGGGPGVAIAHQVPQVDLTALRTATRDLLTKDAGLASDEVLERRILQLREHLALVVPVVEELANGFPEDDVPRACAHAAAMQARTRLAVAPGRSRSARLAHAQRLARSVNALCDHYENLSSEQPAVLDPELAARLHWWNHCLTCETCMTTDETGANANLRCPTADKLHQAYRRAQRQPSALVVAGGRP